VAIAGDGADLANDGRQAAGVRRIIMLRGRVPAR
jgi:hypothetical protein